MITDALPSTYQSYSLEHLHSYIINDLGVEHFGGKSGGATYFKVLILIGAYNEALE